MEVEVHIRKGEKNKKFLKIVQQISDELKNLPSEGRLNLRLLSKLRSDKSNLGAAWQDGDELFNILGPKSEHRFDIYNWETKTAIEIEESEVKYIWKDFIKLAKGARLGRVENAILICPIIYSGKRMKKGVAIYTQAINISKFMADFLWMKNLAIIGYKR